MEMTVFLSFGALFVVLSRAPLSLLDALRSTPSLWYAAIGIGAGATVMAYIIISSLFPRRAQPAPEPTCSGTSNESKTASTTRQTDSQPVNTPQTAESTKSTDHESEPASDENPDPPEPPRPEEKPEPSSTSVKRSQRLPNNAQTEQRPATYTESSRTKKTAGTSIRWNRHVTSPASPGRGPSTGTDNQYFKPVDSSRKIKFAQVDTRFNYLDVDWGPEFIGLDPIPDLVEVNVGPSAVSHELVRSPVEIKVFSYLNALLAPTPRSSGTAAANDSAQPSPAANNSARRRTDDTATTRVAPGDTCETRYRDQDRGVDSRCKPLTAADARQYSTETWPKSTIPESENHRPTTAETIGYGSREEFGTFDDERSSDRRLLGLEPVVREDPIGPQEKGVADDLGVDEGMNYTLPRWEPRQWENDPFGLNDVTTGFSEPEESVVDPLEQPDIGFGMSNWEPGKLIDEPVVDPEAGAEMLGSDVFAEPPEGAVGPPASDVENGSNPLFPEAESFFLEQDAEDDWLRF